MKPVPCHSSVTPAFEKHSQHALGLISVDYRSKGSRMRK